jgi:hypothetical protein
MWPCGVKIWSEPPYSGNGILEPKREFSMKARGGLDLLLVFCDLTMALRWN